MKITAYQLGRAAFYNPRIIRTEYPSLGENARIEFERGFDHTREKHRNVSAAMKGA